VCYDNGIGVEKDEQKAVEWYQKAAEQGHAKAQNSLGWCYANGTGIDKNGQMAVTVCNKSFWNFLFTHFSTTTAQNLTKKILK